MAVTKNPPSFSQRDDIFSFFLESPSLLLFPLCVFTMILQGYLDSPLHDNAIFLVARAKNSHWSICFWSFSLIGWSFHHAEWCNQEQYQHLTGNQNSDQNMHSTLFPEVENFYFFVEKKLRNVNCSNLSVYFFTNIFCIPCKAKCAGYWAIWKIHQTFFIGDGQTSWSTI